MLVIALHVLPGAALPVALAIAGFAGAWGYYLGSSNASSQQHRQMDKALDLATDRKNGGKP